MKNILTLDEYINGIKSKNLAILAKAITLVESAKPEHIELAKEIIKNILPLTGKALRIGISGTPGVGKSTFLENFGSFLIDKKNKLAVLAVDPTSQVTGGSILGDKTRMQVLSAHKDAFVRPSPNGATLGGIAAKTREAMLLCDAFGFDYIFIETVGVGQSEIEVAKLVDFFILLMQPGSGDELQGIKRGILEVSDLVVVNKADGNQLKQAKIAQHDYKRSLEVLNSKGSWDVPVILCSSLEGTGFEDIEAKMNQYFSTVFDKEKRKEQLKVWLESLLVQKFENKIKQEKNIQKKIKQALSGGDLIQAVDDIYKEIIK